MRIDGPQITGSFSLNGDGVQDIDIFATTSSLNTYTSSMATTMSHVLTATHSLNTFTGSANNRMVSIEGKTGSYATTGSNTFVGLQTIQGSIVPSAHATYDLGSAGYNFRHLYLSSASLYIDGTKVLGSTTQELQITTDNGQSFKILEAGSDTITLQSNDGNITLATSGGGDVILDPTTGIIALKGTTQVYAGNKVRSSDGNNIVFGDGLTVSGSVTITGFIEAQELRTTYISSSILYRSGSTKFGDELTDTHAFSGSVLISGSLSVPGSNLVSGSSQVLNGTGIWSGSAQLPLGVISGSGQVDVLSTTNIARLATTGSNTFVGNQVVSGSLTTTGDININSNGIMIDRSSSGEPYVFFKKNGVTRASIYGGNNAEGLRFFSAQNDFSGSITVTGSLTTTSNIGVGTSSPQYKLDVYTAGATSAMRINSDTNQNSQYRLEENGSLKFAITYVPSDSTTRFYFVGAGSDLVTLKSSNFGIGTTNPTNKLDVDGGSSATTLRVSTTNTGAGVASLILANSSKSAFNDGVKLSHGGGYTNITDLTGTTLMTWEMTTSRVGIKTTTPSTTLDVNGTGNYSSRLTVNSSGNYNNTNAALNIESNSWAIVDANVKRQLQRSIGYVGDYEQHVILLHPVYNGTLIEFSKCTGTIYSTRGWTYAGLINDTYHVDTATGYASITATLTSNYTQGRLYTCTYNGVKYIALLPQYRTSATSYMFDGYIANNTGGETLKLISYRNSNTGTILNSEINNSLTPYTENDNFVNGVFYPRQGVRFGSGATTLNYYEEGNFTPTNLGSNMTTVTATWGKYVRIGNQVTINCRWAVSPGGTGQKYLVFNLPFAFINDNTISFTGAVSNYNAGLSAYSSNVGTSVRNSSSSLTQQYVEAVFTSNTNTDLHFSMTYFTF